MEPYSFRIRDVKKFLRHYLSIYEEAYSCMRAWQVTRLIPSSMAGKNVLDVGCGGGFYSLVVCRKGAEDVTLLDISPICVKAAKINLRENANVVPNGVIANATNMRFRKESFDFVILVDIIEHIQADHVLLREIERILKSTGAMIIATQNSNSLNYILEAFIRRHVLKNHSWMGWDSTHVRFYNPSRLFQLLKNSGFSIVKVSGTYFIPYMMTLWLRRISEGISRILYYMLYVLNQKLENHDKIIGLFGWGIICLCQKQKPRTY